MGQAKQRGSFEDRKRKALQAKADYAKKLLAARMARDAAMTPEQRKRRSIAMCLAATISGIAVLAEPEIKQADKGPVK